MEYYTKRDNNGKIVGLFTRPQNPDVPASEQEKLPDDHKDVVAYLQKKNPTNDELYNMAMRNSTLKALISALNDGSFIPGNNLSDEDVKKIIESKM